MFTRNVGRHVSSISKWEKAPRNEVLGSPDKKIFTAERERFELSIPCGMPVFETGALDHSATSPLICCADIFRKEASPNGLPKACSSAGADSHRLFPPS